MDKQLNEPDIEKPFLIMTLILSEHQCQQFVHIAKENGIRSGIIVLGKGTVKSATLNLLGIKSQKKEIVHILLEKEKAKEVLDVFTKKLHLDERGHGIAYMAPVLTTGQIINNKLGTWNTVQSMEGESMYKKLTVVVNRGMAEDVMDVARKSGVKGGTIMHGRGTGSEYTVKFLGMEVEPEKELVMMLMPSDLIDKVVNDLYQEFQLDNTGNGILFVEPVLDVRGLFDPHRDNKDT
ncbi:MAG: P-II family nitrogen regulator [Clostridiaceae bacterium]|jgi:nitrogen regulatory protein PII|nr:P-II family nitrogen regulator [Clostridiaceae bacterium]